MEDTSGAASGPAPAAAAAEDTATTSAAADAPTEGGMPRTVRAIVQILNAMGVQHFEPNVVPQLLEFGQRYIQAVLDEALAYAEHRTAASDPVTITKEDVRLAIQARIDFTNAAPPPREFLLEIAKERNEMPLQPPSDNQSGLYLPPPRYSLTNPNYTVKAARGKRPVPQGPWDLPSAAAAVDAIAAAKKAKMARELRRKQENISTSRAAPSAEGVAAAASAQIGAAAAAKEAAAGDEYDI